jgi:hypothetical protein
MDGRCYESVGDAGFKRRCANKAVKGTSWCVTHTENWCSICKAAPCVNHGKLKDFGEVIRDFGLTRLVSYRRLLQPLVGKATTYGDEQLKP